MKQETRPVREGIPVLQAREDVNVSWTVPGSSLTRRVARTGKINPVSARGKAGEHGGDAARRRDTEPDAETRRLVLERDGYACVCCGASVLGRPYSLQHRKRRSQGGGNSPSNLITVTTGCHARIGSRADPADEAKGYTCRGWQDPAGVPVMVFRPGALGAAVWLADDGTCRLEPPEGRDAA